MKLARMSSACRVMPAISPTTCYPKQSKRRRVTSTSSLLVPALASSKPLGSITEKNFEDIFNVNLRRNLFTVQKAMLAHEGRRVNHSKYSIAGVEGFPGTTSTAPAKGAILSFA